VGLLTGPYLLSDDPFCTFLVCAEGDDHHPVVLPCLSREALILRVPHRTVGGQVLLDGGEQSLQAIQGVLLRDTIDLYVRPDEGQIFDDCVVCECVHGLSKSKIRPVDLPKNVQMT
jgi:hypothetical protein